jgi:hypothetical protein
MVGDNALTAVRFRQSKGLLQMKLALVSVRINKSWMDDEQVLRAWIAIECTSQLEYLYAALQPTATIRNNRSILLIQLYETVSKFPLIAAHRNKRTCLRRSKLDKTACSAILVFLDRNSRAGVQVSTVDTGFVFALCDCDSEPHAILAILKG